MPADFKDINTKIAKIKTYLGRSIFEVIGTESVKHFRESFRNQGFTDNNLSKWPDVKRRDPNSSWYGFKYGNKRNFSDAATRRPILSDTKELEESINYRVNTSARKVIVSSDKIYAKIHNEGGTVRVFGKASAKMPKRQFMGDSKALVRKLEKEIINDLNNILR